MAQKMRHLTSWVMHLTGESGSKSSSPRRKIMADIMKNKMGQDRMALPLASIGLRSILWLVVSSACGGDFLSREGGRV